MVDCRFSPRAGRYADQGIPIREEIPFMCDLIIRSFEMAAERAEDITPDVYRRYYTLAPEAARVMSHMDVHMQGRMMNEVLQLLMTAPEALPGDYLTFEVANHTRAYGVSLELYRPLFEAVKDTVRTAAGADWSDDLATAWAKRIEALETELLSVAPTTTR
jgi:hypothetical protein